MSESANRAIIGVLGVGHIAEDLVEGWIRAGMEADRLLLSARGRRTAEALHRSHGIAIAADNGDLVRRSEVVVMCLRPAAAPAVLSALPWRAGQLLISVATGLQVAALAETVAPAAVARAMPISAARWGASPTTLFPDTPRARALLALLGGVLAMPDETSFERATISAALYGWVMETISWSEAWLTRGGVPSAIARELTAETFAAAGRMVAATDAPVQTMIARLATPGGITHAGQQSLREAGAEKHWRAALDAAHGRLAALRGESG